MSEATDLHEKMWDTIRNQDFEALRALYHPDFIYAGPDGQERKGADASIAVAQTHMSAFPDLSFEFRHRHASGEDVSIIELAFRGTHQGELEGISPTGRQVEGVGCNVIDVRDGKIYRERDYFDNLALLSQLGVSPQTGK